MNPNVADSFGRMARSQFPLKRAGRGPGQRPKVNTSGPSFGNSFGSSFSSNTGNNGFFGSASPLLSSPINSPQIMVEEPQINLNGNRGKGSVQQFNSRSEQYNGAVKEQNENKNDLLNGIQRFIPPKNLNYKKKNNNNNSSRSQDFSSPSPPPSKKSFFNGNYHIMSRFKKSKNHFLGEATKGKYAKDSKLSKLYQEYTPDLSGRLGLGLNSFRSRLGSPKTAKSNGNANLELSRGSVPRHKEPIYLTYKNNLDSSRRNGSYSINENNENGFTNRNQSETSQNNQQLSKNSQAIKNFLEEQAGYETTNFTNKLLKLQQKLPDLQNNNISRTTINTIKRKINSNKIGPTNASLLVRTIESIIKNN